MKVVIFGVGRTADIAYRYLLADSQHTIAAFTAEADHLVDSDKFGLPVCAFDAVEKHYPPSDYALFAPCTGTNMNRYRERVYHTGKAKGYTFISYVSSRASIMSNDIGENCLILEHNTVQPFVKIGNNCVLWSGNHIGHHTTIEDHVFIASHVVISSGCLIKRYSWLGVNSALRDGITLGEGSVIGMSASVTKNTEGNAIYVGLPAKRLKSCDESLVL